MDIRKVEKYIKWRFKRIEELKRNKGASKGELVATGFISSSVDQEINSLYRDINFLRRLKGSLDEHFQATTSTVQN
ncbi:hypothetical protein AWH56_018515 [Anaerobacillus isosaccharinicus]|uniref:Uncharacterized protein n=1 Tax=Anaerobacillus isosaccharinicus TaxID=1532552 RepID=A0A1S2LLC0_9BACI|nr:hypothetical protein [Anaerobacillus isosaccharinicus]MBA5587101.1 hypothetical protein [Anaerobacillus isosaccharinicus]QOY34703.1 hypothetical protein AWH56_018515 [Anaerobacillus isosaccharinicus]